MDIINQVKHSILSPYGMEEKDIDKIMDSMLSATVDDADIYFQASHFESWVLEGGIVKEGSHSIEQGAGVRVVSGEKTGFAYSDRIELSVLLEADKKCESDCQTGTNSTKENR